MCDLVKAAELGSFTAATALLDGWGLR